MREELQAALGQVRLRPADLAGLSEIDRHAGGWRIRPPFTTRRLENLQAEIGHQAALAARSCEEAVPPSANEATTPDGQPGLSTEHRSYTAAVQWVVDEGAQLSLSEALVVELHQRLVKSIRPGGPGRGRYRNAAHSKSPRSKIIVQVGVVPVARVPIALTELIDWYRDQSDGGACHPLFPVSVFVVQFLRISPFAVGNRRMAMLLLRYLLLRAGYEFVSYTAIEALCLEEKFPKPVELTKGRAVDVNWAQAFSQLTDILFQAVFGLEALAASDKRKTDQLPALSNRILALFEKQPRLQVGEIVDRTKANRNTVKLHLRKLVALGCLTRSGAGRSCWYAQCVS